MLLEYRDIVVALYNGLLWPLLIMGFVFNRDANVRWFVLGFMIITAFSMLSGDVIKAFGAPGWVFHLSKIGIAYLVMLFVLYRPKLSINIGLKLQRLPLASVSGFMAVCLPAYYPFRLVPAELALRRLYMAMMFVHGAVILNAVFASYGLTNAGGLLEQHGYHRLILWDAAYSVYLVFLILELLLLAIIVVGGLRSQFTA